MVGYWQVLVAYSPAPNPKWRAISRGLRPRVLNFINYPLSRVQGSIDSY